MQRETPLKVKRWLTAVYLELVLLEPKRVFSRASPKAGVERRCFATLWRSSRLGAR